ncbi:hypothetical protein [Tabrizicola sp.]|uniref:hypothetical protein n=1 Tax=Tabrizicola sp. TaxID=2005166 RepID=UPI002FDE2D58
MRVRAVFLLCLAILFALTPLMLPSFDGYDPEDFPVQVLRPSVQPAGYAFSIWLVIYAGLILHAGFGLLRRADDPVWDRPRLPLMAALVLGTTWVALAEDQPVAGTVTILVMLAAALVAVLRTGREDRLWLMPPIALLAGWVTAAAGAASGVTLAGLGWLTDTASAVVCILAVLVLAAAMQLRVGRVPEYGAAVIWALVGIVVANWGLNPTVAWLALAGAVVMGAVTVLAWRRG